MMLRSFELDLQLGVANLLADNPAASVPLWSEYSAVWDEEAESYVPNPPRPADAVAIYIDSYDDADTTVGPYVVVSEYSVDDSDGSAPVVGVQFTIRAEDIAMLKAITSDIYALLHMRWGGMLGPVTLVTASRSSGTRTGQDSSNRQGRIENYYLRVYRSTPNRQE